MKPWAEHFYASKAWKLTRDAYLKSKHHLCERHLPANPTVASIVHHKVCLSAENINDPMISLCWDNLEALCQECHNQEHHGSPSNLCYEFDEEGNLLPKEKTPSQKITTIKE